MKSQANESLHAMIWTTAISLILFCATAIAAITGWVPGALGYTGENPAPTRIEWSRTDSAKPAAAASKATVVEPHALPRRSAVMAYQEE
jgi:hypothetical protein